MQPSVVVESYPPSKVVHLVAGSVSLAVICAIIGLSVNAFRTGGISGIKAISCERLVASHELGRHEILYLQSADFVHLDLSQYEFVDVRPIPQYSVEHVRGALPMQRTDHSAHKTIVFYDSASLGKKAKKALIKGNWPVYVLVDGFEGWKSNGLATEKGRW